MKLKNLNQMQYIGSIFVSALLLGCATILTGTEEIINIASEPSGAQVYINDKNIGSTPTQYSFNKSKNLNITVKKEGYEVAKAVLERHFNPMTLLNTVDILGYMVDIATGAAWSFDSNSINVELKLKEQSFTQTPKPTRVVVESGAL